jgi:hypothetical protein
MALKKISLAPGFNKQATASQAEGQWQDGDNVRFRYGAPEKIGGWEQVDTSEVKGVARALHNWSDLDGTKYTALGTDKVLVLESGGAFYDISPLKSTVATCTLDSTTGSSTVTVNKTSHGLSEGDLLLFSNITLPGGGATGFTAANFTSVTYEVQSNTANTFQVQMQSNETGTGMSAAGNVDLKPYEEVGPSFQTFQYGWGTNTWNLSTWGTTRPSAGVILDPGKWSLDNFGQLLIATIHNGKSFSWDPSASNPFEQRAALITNAPTAAVKTLVSDRDRHLIFLGTETTIGDTTTQDKMFIRFSDQENLNDYTPTSTNTAGTFQIDQGTKIVGGVQAKDYTLIVTDKAAYLMQFVGPPFTFSIRQVGSDCGLAGQNAIIYANGMVFWMSNSGGFYVFDGTVKSLPCSVEDFVFDTQGDDLGINLNEGSELISTGHNPLFSEVSWFYTQATSTQNDRIVTYNYAENVWTTGSLARTSWVTSGVLPLPRATEYLSSRLSNFPVISGNTQGATILYDHETGTNQIRNYTTGSVTSAISSSIESGDFDLDIDGDGEYFMSMNRFVPDFKYLNSTCNVTILLRRYPNDSQSVSPLGPFTINSTTDKVNTRARSRLAAIKISADQVSNNWRYGLFRFDANADGKR